MPLSDLLYFDQWGEDRNQQDSLTQQIIADQGFPSDFI